MSDNEDGEHQLHITISKALHKDIKDIMPEYGSISTLIRNFLRRFASSYKDAICTTSNITEKSPFDKTVDDMANNVIAKKRMMNGGGD